MQQNTPSHLSTFPSETCSLWSLLTPFLSSFSQNSNSGSWSALMVLPSSILPSLGTMLFTDHHDTKALSVSPAKMGKVSRGQITKNLINWLRRVSRPLGAVGNLERLLCRGKVLDVWKIILEAVWKINVKGLVEIDEKLTAIKHPEFSGHGCSRETWIHEIQGLTI